MKPENAHYLRTIDRFVEAIHNGAPEKAIVKLQNEMQHAEKNADPLHPIDSRLHLKEGSRDDVQTLH